MNRKKFISLLLITPLVVTAIKPHIIQTWYVSNGRGVDIKGRGHIPSRPVTVNYAIENCGIQGRKTVYFPPNMHKRSVNDVLEIKIDRWIT